MSDVSETLLPKRIIIFDDDFHTAMLYKLSLETAGFITDIVTETKNVIEEAVRRKTDLVFVDLMIPHREGFEVLKKLKSDPKTKATPVIILTTMGHMEYIERGLSLGAADYLLKTSVTPEKIKDIARKHLVFHNARFHDE